MEGSLPVKDLPSLLREKFDDVKIEHVDWKNLTDPGENFGSLIIAVNAKLASSKTKKTESKNFVIKLPPPSSWLQDLFNSPLTFYKELAFYRDLSPRFIELQRENGIDDAQSNWLGADFYGGRMSLDETKNFDHQAAIILENLNNSNYRTVDRLTGLSLSQTKLAIEKLSKLHAIAIAMREKKPDVFEKLVLPALSHPANEMAKNCVMDMVKKAIEDLKDIPECKPYLEKVDKTMGYIEKRESELANVEKNHWATLVHNDFWVNNMMFRNDESGNAIDMKIVDFQLCVYDYGIKDFIFFVISSPTIRVIDQHFDELTQLYYDSFIKSLESLACDISKFTEKQFYASLEEYAPLKFAQCLMMNQVIKSKPGAAPKMEDIDCKESFLSIGGGQDYQERMLHTVQFFNKRHWFKE